MRRLLLLPALLLLTLPSLAQSRVELHAGPTLAMHPKPYHLAYPLGIEGGVRYNSELSEWWRLTARGGYEYANADAEDAGHLDTWTAMAGLRLHPDEIGIEDYMGIEVGARWVRADGISLDGETILTERKRYVSARAYMGFIFKLWRDYLALEPAITMYFIDGDPYAAASLQLVLPIWS